MCFYTASRMNEGRQPQAVMKDEARRLIGAQAILVAIVAIAFGLMGGVDQAAAAGYGGLITIMNSLLMSRRVRQATKRLALSPMTDVASMMLGLLERLVFTLVALYVAFAWLGFDPVPLLVGLAVTYLGYPCSRLLA